MANRSCPECRGFGSIHGTALGEGPAADPVEVTCVDCLGTGFDIAPLLASALATGRIGVEISPNGFAEVYHCDDDGAVLWERHCDVEDLPAALERALVLSRIGQERVADA